MPRQTEEQRARRQARAYETSKMTKCACGNVAKLGTTTCSACANPAIVITREDRLNEMLAWFEENRPYLDTMITIHVHTPPSDNA